MKSQKDNNSVAGKDVALELAHDAIDDLIINGYSHHAVRELKKCSNYAGDDLGVKDHLMDWVEVETTNNCNFGFILKYSSCLSANDINLIIDKISNSNPLDKYEKGFELLTLAQSICKNYPEYVDVIDFGKLYSTELMANFNGNYLMVMDWMKLNPVYARKIIELFVIHNLFFTYVSSLYHDMHTLGSDYEYFCTLFNLEKSSRLMCEHFIDYCNLPPEILIGINI